MLYIVTYDFPSTPQGDRRRARLAKLLEGVALRVQYSVFELEIPPERLPQLASQIEDRIDPTEDSVRLYPACGACAARVQHFGRKAVCEHGPLLIW
jgi:CRISPR-associated protein Cas2